ncbi:hypothetical protein G4G28_11450 [Massilia sp. Dwa41.01b]|uniref:hypothetical protein n=1 Tax=unclassified Massilia TaxID=2609279 RepID=UPI0015FFDA83|nr:MULTISPECIES: hypothetical protein [unclassified Massilia]QNA88949.1 hypothetical protein G4G28_11450 [Massilia sp. Dwa41.01b]QNA99837.1 hypothetical protein G4G31_15085 [Massilia sp. Se16.2.3]
MTKTRAYREAHGVVSGAVNELRLGGVLFRFPPDSTPEPYSAGPIVRGEADSVHTHLDLSGWIAPRPRIRSEANGMAAGGCVDREISRSAS